MRLSAALECFVGGWGVINGTIRNTVTGELAPDWHGVVPSGISVYGPNSYFSYIIAANDKDEPQYRPRDVTLPAKPSDSLEHWAIVAQHSVAAGGPATFSNVTGRCRSGADGQRGGDGDGARGTMHTLFITSTLPAWVGFEQDIEFEFHDGDNLHVLRSYVGQDLLQTAWFKKLPAASGSGNDGRD